MNNIDFTNCKRILSKAYNGANGKKIAVMYDGKQYMLKFPPNASKKPNGLSYSNSCISEYIGSNVFNIIGIPDISKLKKDFYKIYITARYEKFCFLHITV